MFSQLGRGDFARMGAKGSKGTGAGPATGVARQWVAPPGVAINTETTIRQWMAAPGVYFNLAL